MMNISKKKDEDAELEQENEDKSAYETCRDAIQKLIAYLKINVFEQIDLYQRLRDWLTLPHDKLHFFELIGNNNDPMGIWEETIKSKEHKIWKNLADIALRMNSIATTETNFLTRFYIHQSLSKSKARFIKCPTRSHAK